MGSRPGWSAPAPPITGTPSRGAEANPNSGLGPFVIDQKPWWVTLFTSMFMHGGILHIAGNMLFLWVFGNNIEDRLGRLRSSRSSTCSPG